MAAIAKIEPEVAIVMTMLDDMLVWRLSLPFIERRCTRTSVE
jgi:hypothetical protein